MLGLALPRAISGSALDAGLPRPGRMRTALAAVRPFLPAPGAGPNRQCQAGSSPAQEFGRPVATRPARPERMQGHQARKPPAWVAQAKTPFGVAPVAGINGGKRWLDARLEPQRPGPAASPRAASTAERLAPGYDSTASAGSL